MGFEETAKRNEKDLKENLYPGRGIIIGKSPNGRYYYQVYWIMGRSENSRNRVFEQEGFFVKTKAFDANKVVDPSLIIYYPIKNIGHIHIVSNGDQTDTIYNYLQYGKSLEEALFDRTFEPDAPNFTPRISGIVNLQDDKHEYVLSILKAEDNNADYCKRLMFYYDRAIPGYGHCIHTYKGDGDPLPSFQGEPYLVRLFDDCEQIAEYYWDLLNEENKISLLVKQLDTESKDFKITIKNKLQ